MARHTEAVAITGIGIIANPGRGLEEVWRNVMAMRDGIAPWRHAPPGPLAAIKVAACSEPPRPEDLPQRLWRGLSRTQQLAITAVDEALALAKLPRQINSESAGLFMATTVCGMDLNEQFYEQYRVDPEKADVNLFRHQEPFEVLRLIARRHRLSGSRQMCLTTCVGSALSIGAAADWIRSREGDLAIAGGTEALCRVLLGGFASLKVAAADGCRPYDRNRPGITVGEASAVLVLESIAHARQRGVPILAYLGGFAATCDGYHITAPDPAGTQAARAMREAIAESGLTPGAIGYVNTHGTGTRDNDAMEATALGEVFKQKVPPVSSTKRMTGHTFAAAGAVEAALCVQTLRTGMLPANVGTLEQDPAIDLPLVRNSQAKAVEAVLSCNFAFGGNNTALVILRGDAT